MSDVVLFDLDEHGIATITINRPEVRNALNWEAMEAFADAVHRAESTPDLSAMIVTGAGQQAFISGGDLRDLHRTSSEADGLRQHDLMASALDALEALPVPVIAAIEGAARGGGCEVLLACDMRVAAEDATLGFAQIHMAVTPGWGGARRLLELVGYAHAFELLLTGGMLSARKAYAIGLVNHITPRGRALTEARRIALQFANGPQGALRGVKEVLRAHLRLPPEAARAREREIFARLWASPDHAEAVLAFLERREPVFSKEAGR